MIKTAFFALCLAASPLAAAVVTMTDGSSVSGEVKEQADGSVVVTTAAGDVSVAKDKIRSIVQDSAASSQAEGDTPYVQKVKERRAYYGNEDGIPRSSLLNTRQVAFTVGQVNYLGDALTVTDPSSGAILAGASAFSTLHYGLSIADNFNDVSGWELWGGYGIGEAGFNYAGKAYRATAQRVDVGVNLRVQKAIDLGRPEQGFIFLPSFGLGPVYTNTCFRTHAFDRTAGNSIYGSQVSSNALGIAASLGLDLQLGSALVGAKLRYAFSSDMSGGLNSSNLSAFLPQLAVGIAF